MKPIARAVPALLLLLLFPVSLYAISVFDVIRMTQEKYSDQEIVKVIRVTDSRFVLTAEDTSRLKKEGVTENVIREMLSRPAREKAAPPAAQSAPKPARSSSAASYSRKDVPADARTQPLEPASVLDEIVRLTKAGQSDEMVLAYAKAHRAELPSDMPADRLAWLRESGVSQNVILYLTAIDVRASGESAPESATYASDEGETYPVPAQSAPGYRDEGVYYGDGGSYASHPDDYASYPVGDYASYYDYPSYGGYYYPYDAYYSYYPYYPYYAYPAYFFFDNFHHHGHGHDGHGHGHDGGDGHHHGSGHQGSPGDQTRGHGGNTTAGQTWRERPALVSNNFTQTSRQTRGDIVSRGGMGGSAMPRGLDRVYRGSGGPGVVSRPGFSGGRGQSGAMASRAPISRSGGGFGAPARPAFSGGGGRPGGGSVGRAPIARSGGGGMGRSGGGGMGHSGGGGRGR